jgi:3-dehydroquinate synthase
MAQGAVAVYSDEMQSEIRQAFSVGYSFPVLFTRNSFETSNLVVRDAVRAAGAKRHRVLLVVDSNLADATPGLLAKIKAYGDFHADTFDWAGPPFIVRGGEICKSDPREVEELHELVAKYKIDRQSFILAVGGGAMLDAVGYAAATAHRGVRLIRMPTTTLGQNDAGIGVKNSINAYGRKNFLGTFAPPFAVINDYEFLRTLPARELRAGMAEAVKIACIKDAEFLSWMHRERKALGAFVPEAVEQLIERCARGHIEHVGSADPFESGSARPLDFGHWSAHFLEELTGNELRHGEAVAIGCALDSTYAFEQRLINEVELGKVMHTLEDMGFELFHPALQRMDIEEALGQFREHLGGEMCITVPDPLGRRRELHQIDLPLMKQCIQALATRHQRREMRSQKSATG